MTKPVLHLLAGWCSLVLLAGTAVAQDPEKVTLRYKFQPGETLRWNVVHRSMARTTIAKLTQTAETTSSSVKVWRVTEVKPDGTARFEHSVEDADMRQQVSGQKEIRYNSRTDKEPPTAFNGVAEALGIPLSDVTLDARGQVVKRQRKSAKSSATNEGQITIPLPEEPVAVGATWSFPHDLSVLGTNGLGMKIRTLQRFTLQSVKTGVATIAVETQILTPIHDPAIESQVIQHQSSGTVRFDVDAGRILSQQMDLDKHLVGFRGETSSLHYVTRFTEDLFAAQARTADKTAAVKVADHR
jgi:hypothetical protein